MLEDPPYRTGHQPRQCNRDHQTRYETSFLRRRPVVVQRSVDRQSNECQADRENPQNAAAGYLLEAEDVA